MLISSFIFNTSSRSDVLAAEKMMNMACSLLPRCLDLVEETDKQKGPFLGGFLKISDVVPAHSDPCCRVGLSTGVFERLPR